MWFGLLQFGTAHGFQQNLCLDNDGQLNEREKYGKDDQPFKLHRYEKWGEYKNGNQRFR